MLDVKGWAELGKGEQGRHLSCWGGHHGGLMVDGLLTSEGAASFPAEYQSRLLQLYGTRIQLTLDLPKGDSGKAGSWALEWSVCGSA